jgi:hypothetical protein
MTRSAMCIILLALAAGFAGCSSGDVDDNSDELTGQASQPLVIYDTLPTSGTKTVSATVWPGTSTYIIMSSPSAGSWKFETYGSPGGWYSCLTSPPDFAVFTFWRANSGSPWNEWGGGGPVCHPTSVWSTILYSGSSSIQYKLDYEAYSDYGQTVYTKFTKQ